ncbi:hypothetical protein J5N97_009295 [Dioscorea zingiberensis]|uniref:Uncharacterized protein n=1 Tax=Dioscorea zingiberensis TaxID=325984 RepID=A0A9D5CZ63_9LILI|nr:hypothetical protein J5N97_009295 [Dioscorea zingiberensis]
MPSAPSDSPLPVSSSSFSEHNARPPLSPSRPPSRLGQSLHLRAAAAGFKLLICSAFQVVFASKRNLQSKTSEVANLLMEGSGPMFFLPSMYLDVERRADQPAPAHAAGLRRLSTRAATSPAPTPTRNGLLPLILWPDPTPRPSPLLQRPHHSRSASPTRISPALRPRAGLPFPLPILRAVLSLGLPSGPGYRLAPASDLPRLLPIAAASLQVAPQLSLASHLGPRPLIPPSLSAQPAPLLRRAPSLIPSSAAAASPPRPSLTAAYSLVFRRSHLLLQTRSRRLLPPRPRLAPLPPESLPSPPALPPAPPEKPRRLPPPWSLDSVARRKPHVGSGFGPAPPPTALPELLLPEPSPQCFLGDPAPKAPGRSAATSIGSALSSSLAAGTDPTSVRSSTCPPRGCSAATMRSFWMTSRSAAHCCSKRTAAPTFAFTTGRLELR